MHAWAEVCHLLQAACPPSQASYAVLVGESQAFFKHSPLTNSIPNSAILRNNYISLLKVQSSKWFVRMRTREEKWRRKGSHSSSASGSNRLVWHQTWKKRWAGALLSEKCCCFVRKPSWKSHANLNEPVWRRRRRKTFWPSGDFFVRDFRDAF